MAIWSSNDPYAITCPKLGRVEPDDECDTLQDVPCLMVPFMEVGRAEAELSTAPHLSMLNDVKLDGEHNCVVLLTETEELGYIGAAYLAARQRDVYTGLPFNKNVSSPCFYSEGLLPVLPLSPMDSENTMDSFGELLTVGQPCMGGDGFSPSDNSWVLDDGDYPLLIAPETCWYGMTELIAREVARRRLTIVMLDKKYDGEQGEGRLRTLRQDLNFTCGAQIVELNKPDQLSDYNRYILKTELYKNNIHIEDDPYDDILTHLDEFRRSHGGLCNSNILRYVKVLRKQGKKDCRVELTRAQALAPITLQSQENALQAAADLAAEMKEELWGCESVKAQLESIVDLMQMDCTRRKRGLPTSGHGQILLFAGAPGTGKTTAAKMLCDWLKGRRLLDTTCDDLYKQVSGAQLKAPYVGNTAPLVHDLFKNSAFLFIDEAYALAENGQENDNYAQEAMAQLCVELENLPEDRVVVFAGYGGRQNRMRAFLDANPGLASRITATVQFDAYSPDKEMPAIFAHHAAARGLTLPKDWEKTVVAYFTRRAVREDYGSGREARRLLESCLTAQSHRLMADEKFDADTLRTLTSADLKAAIAQLESGFAALDTAKTGKFGV